MDLMSLLPTEVAQNIFKLLHVEDLYRCMAVSKSWRKVVNCNYVWGHFYKLYGIEEILDEISNNMPKTQTPLCTRAVELKRYLLSPAFNWRVGRSNNFYINLKYRYWKVVCYEPYFAVLYLSVNELHVYCCYRNSFQCIDVISVNVPQNSLEQPILISPSYIVLGFYNITFVYKLTNGHFKLFKLYALSHGQNVYRTNNDFDYFIQQYVLPNHNVFERVLLVEMLWIMDESGTKHIINLNTGEEKVVTSPLIFTKAFLHLPYVLNYIDTSVSIADLKGAEISCFTVSHADKIFHMNAATLVICFPRVIENQKYEIECRDLSGTLKRKLYVHERTKVTLHSKKAILYLLSTPQDMYMVTSFSIESGFSLWKYEAISGPHMFWGSFLSLIEDRFLFVYPAPSSDDMYALFNLQGELLSERTFTTGVLLYFSDVILLAKEEGRLHLSTFL